MVDASLSLPGDPATPVLQPKGRRLPIEDGKPDGEFASAVAIAKDRAQLEPQETQLADTTETVVLDPDMDPDAVAEAVAEAVAAVIAAVPAVQQDSGPSPRDAGAMVMGLNTLSTLQLRTVVPEPAGAPPAKAPPGDSEPEPVVAMPVESLQADESPTVGRFESLPLQRTETLRRDQSSTGGIQMMAASAAAAEAPPVDRKPVPPLPDAATNSAEMAVQTATAADIPVAMPAGTAPVMRTVPQPAAGRPPLPASERGTARTEASAAPAQEAAPLAPPDASEVAAATPQPVAETAELEPDHAGRRARQDADLPASHSSQPAQPSPFPQQQNLPLSPFAAAVTQPTVPWMSLPGQASLPALDQARMVQVLPPDPQATQPQRQIEIILAPPELGAVRVVITRDDGEMRIEMVASTGRAVEVLEQARESMVDSIRDTGMRPGPIEIRQDFNAPRNLAGGEFAGNSAWHGRHEQARPQTGDGRSLQLDRAPVPTGAADGNPTRGRQGLIL